MSESFLTFTFKIGDEVIQGDLGKELKIDASSPDVLAQQLEENPARAFYWGSVAETAELLAQAEQISFDLWYAPIYKQVKEELIEQFGKSGLTESQIKYEILNRYEDEYKHRLNSLNKAKYRKKVLSLARHHYSEKHDALINLLSFYKKQKDQV